MRTPLTYYGGKQVLAGRIVAAIPSHTTYVEPFVGGGAVFWRKEPSKHEVLNDINGEIVNFYRILQQRFSELRREVEVTLFARDAHRRAKVIYQNPDMFDEVKRAWAVWVLSAQSYSAVLGNTWVVDQGGKGPRTVARKRDEFIAAYSERLKAVTLENRDAIAIVTARDRVDTFHYCDPPYVGADQGHYDGYTAEDFDLLLKTLADVKGRFLLSSYPSAALDQYTASNGWDQVVLTMTLASSNTGRKKREVLTANYPIRHLFGEGGSS